MKCLYFDCFSGISGDMTLGALIDLGVPHKYLREELKRLELSGYALKVSRVMRQGISARQVTVKRMTNSVAGQHRSFKDIERIIARSSLKAGVKHKSTEIFMNLAKAEAKIHNRKIQDVHFHEVGAIDSIVDIVGSVIGMDYLGIENFYSSEVPLGRGVLKCEHGTLPVPAPATLSLLKGVPVYHSGTNSEMVTPTGAAILTGFAGIFGGIPPMKVSATGYGAGTRQEGDRPNLLRLIMGDDTCMPGTDWVVVIETNLDDMNPEWTGFLMERLFEEGALDVMLVPVYMKKNRPGILLKVVCREDLASAITQVVFNESTTGGVRCQRVQRNVLARTERKVKTRFGMMKVKVFKGVRGENITPEYEECRKVAKKKGIPLREVYEEIIRTATFFARSSRK